MENEILKIIIKMIYNDKFIEAYENRLETIDFPLKINLLPNIKVLTDFNNEYFKAYEQTLIQNAIIFALENKELNYLNFIKTNINNIKQTLENDIIFKTKTTELAFKNIVSKIKIDENKMFFNKELNDKTINNNISLFEKINIIYSEINFITNFYHKLLSNFLSKYQQIEQEKQLDIFLNTNTLDEEFIKSTDNFITQKDLLQYKYFIVRLILSDNYLQLETIILEEELDNYIKQINRTYNNDYTLDDEFDEENEDLDEDSFIEEIDIKVLNYIYNCLKINKFALPKDNELRHNMLINFIIYNGTLDKEYDIETIEGNKEKTLNLKRINPLYKLDKIKFD